MISVSEFDVLLQIIFFFIDLIIIVILCSYVQLQIKDLFINYGLTVNSFFYLLSILYENVVCIHLIAYGFVFNN